MDERVIQFRIGVMVLASVIIAAILLVMFGEGPELFRSKYVVRIRASAAAGVNAKTPVRQRGILIGRVKDVRLDDEQVGVIILAEINSDRRLRANEVCQITSGLLGEAELNFVPPDTEPLSDTIVEEGAVIPGQVLHGPTEVIGNLETRMADAIVSVTETSKELQQAIQRISGVLERNEGRIDSILAKADGSMGVIEEAVSNVNEVVSDPEVRGRLREALAEAPDMFRQMKETLERMNSTFDLVDRNLRNVEDFTQPLGERGESLVSNIERATDKLDRLMAQMLVFSETLNSGEGTLVQLINNPDLYQNLNRASANIEDITRQLQPIIHDARVFSDKIARHPELLGVRGALQRNAGTKGVPRLSTQNTPAIWLNQ